MMAAQYGSSASVTVYVPVADRRLVETVGFYRADIEALQAAGFDVRVATRLRELRPGSDLFLVWWWTRALPVVIGARLLRKPVLVTGVFNWFGPDGFSSRPWWQRAVMKLSARLATSNLFLSRAELAGVSSGLGLENGEYFPCAVACVGNGGCEFPAEPDLSEELRDLRDATVISTIAWSARANLVRKCVFESVAAFEQIAGSHPDAVLVVAGHAGDGALELAERCRTSPAARQIVTVGQVDEPTKHWLLRRTSIFLSPSRYEGFGLAIAEAGAHGCAVITSDVGEVREVMGDGARYCNCGDVWDIAATLEALLGDSDERHRLIAGAAASVRRFSSDRKLADVRSLVEPFLNRM